MSELEPTRTYSNHTATDELLVTGYPNSLRPELHKALKARGIDYWVAQGITFWNRDDGCECLAYGYKVNGVPKLAIKVVGFTDPEQAIAATLGVTDAKPTQAESSGTCHDVWDVELTGRLRFQCSECGAVSLEITPRFCPVCGRKVVEPTTNDVGVKEDA